MSRGRCAISAALRFISLGCRRASFSGSTDEGMNPSRHLVIFLRAPRLGRVKSRLAAGIGALAALRFYRLATARLLRRVARDRRWRCHVWITPDRAPPRPPGRAPGLWRGQGGGDLGRRMARVFRTLPPRPAVILGSDVPPSPPAPLRPSPH